MAELSIDQQLMVRPLVGRLASGRSARQLVAAAREVFFAAGAVIYRAGEATAHIHIVLEGRVALEAVGQAPWTFGSGGVFGLLDAEMGEAHERTARAIDDVRAVAIRVEDWLDIVEDDLPLTLQRMAQSADDILARALALGEAAFAPPPLGAAQPELVAQLQLKSGAPSSPFERLVALRLAPAFSRARTQALLRLAREAAEVRLEAGEALYDAGAPAGSIHVVIEGEMIMRRGRSLQAAYSPFRLLGGVAGFGHVTRPMSATAGTDARLLEIPLDHLHDVMEDHFDLVRALSAFLARERHWVQTLVPPKG